MSPKDRATISAMNACLTGNLDGAIITAGMMRDFHATLSAAGFVVAPRIPDRGMLEAARLRAPSHGTLYEGVWGAMLAATESAP